MVLRARPGTLSALGTRRPAGSDTSAFIRRRSCEHCYAEGFQKRFFVPNSVRGAGCEEGRTVPRREGSHEAARVAEAAARLRVQHDRPLLRRAHRRGYRQGVRGYGLRSGHHQFQVLTKRADRMREYVSGPWWERFRDNLTEHKRRMDINFKLSLSDTGITRSRMSGSEHRSKTRHERTSVYPSCSTRRHTVRFLSVEPLLGSLSLLDCLSVPHPLNLASTYTDQDGVERLDLNGQRIDGIRLGDSGLARAARRRGRCILSGRVISEISAPRLASHIFLNNGGNGPMSR